MSTGQRLREVKEEISRIERFLPVMKRVLTLLRAEIRAYQERVDDLEAGHLELESRWRHVSDQPQARTIDAAVEAEVLTRPESLVGVDIDELVAVQAHSRLSPALTAATAGSQALQRLALERRRTREALELERGNLARLEEAEQEFVLLINGSEQVRLPPLREELARLGRQLDEENGMAATVARLLRERAGPRETDGMEVWQLLA